MKYIYRTTTVNFFGGHLAGPSSVERFREGLGWVRGGHLAGPSSVVR